MCSSDLNKICYAAISIRTDKIAVMQFCEEFDYRPVCFTANQDVEGERMAIYHTNVMMCVADTFAVICLDTIDDKAERENVEENLIESGKEIIEITEEQNKRFAGNMLQLMGDKPYLVMSKDRKSTRLNSSHVVISYAVFCLKKKKTYYNRTHTSLATPTSSS